MKERTCFVISPIGDENSKIRENADLFLNVVKEVAELHNLHSYRADEMTGTSDINMDVMNSVINSELCIVDLTGLNANVMFEFGVRYQTELPYIICASSGTKLPFDTISKRTIFYNDLTQTKNATALRDTLRSFIRQFEKNNYKVSSTISLNTIYELLQSVNQKVERMGGHNNIQSLHDNVTFAQGEEDALIRELGGAGAFAYAYESRNIKLAESVIEYCRNLPNFENKLCALACMGSKKATKELLDKIDEVDFNPNEIQMLEVIGSATTGVLMSYSENIEKMKSLLDKCELLVDTDEQRAFVLNQKERIFAFEEKWDDALLIAERVLRLDDTKLGYQYNYACTLKKLNRNSEAREEIKKVINQLEDDDHLILAYQLLNESSNPIDQQLAEDCYDKLRIHYPYKAQMLKYGILGN